MLSVLARSVAFDIWENAVVAGLINGLWISLAFLLAIACASVSAIAPSLAVLLIAASAILLIALLGPIGVYLKILARRETPELPVLYSALLRSLGGSMAIALGGMGGLSIMTIALPLTLGLPDTVGVATTILIGWTCFMIAQWMVLAVGHCSGGVVSPTDAARDAAVLVLARPGYSTLVLVGTLLSMATLVILLPGPSGAALLARRAADFAGDRAEFDRTAAAMSRRSNRSVIFPWKL